MRAVAYAVAGLLAVIAACSTGSADETELSIPPQEDATAPGTAQSEDAGSDPDADAERPLVCGDAGFCETRLPRSDLGLPLSLRGVWVVAPNNVWTVTTEGYVLHHDGTTWTVEYRANHALHAVWASAASVWVGGERGLLFRRNAAGEWSRIAPGHVAPIRAIYGTSDSDVWFTRDGSALDHFDGAKLTKQSVDVPGLRITTVFGRKDFGTFAAGHVEGELTDAGTFADEPHAFELSGGNLSVVNPSLSEHPGFVPVSGFVTNSTNPDRKILMVGYERRHGGTAVGMHEQLHFAHFMLGAANVIEIAKPDSPGVLNPTSDGDEARPVLEMLIPGLNYKASDIRLLLHMGQVVRWDGRSLTFHSLAMGYDVTPAPVFGAHTDGTESWVVGDGFALKGATP